jgi:hypothetical protein
MRTPGSTRPRRIRCSTSRCPPASRATATSTCNTSAIRASNEVFMSPLSYGVVPFSVNVDARRNALTVDAPDRWSSPATTATFKLHAAHPDQGVLFAVDEGILQVAHYKLGDPLKFFFRKRMLEVQTSQILDLILPDFKKADVAGRARRRRRRCDRPPAQSVQAQARQAGRLLVRHRRCERREGFSICRAGLFPRQAACDGRGGVARHDRHRRRRDHRARRFRVVAQRADHAGARR